MTALALINHLKVFDCNTSWFNTGILQIHASFVYDSMHCYYIKKLVHAKSARDVLGLNNKF